MVGADLQTIVPALAVRKAGRHGLKIGYGMGAAGYGLGLVVSALFDMPAGAVIVLSLVCIGLLTSLFIKAFAQKDYSESA